MATVIQEAVARHIVSEKKELLMGMSKKERLGVVKSIQSKLESKSDDELLSVLSSNEKDVSPEIKQRKEIVAAMKSRTGGSMLMGTKALPDELESFEKAANKAAELQELGVDISSPLPAGSIEIGFSDSPAKAVKTALSEKFGRDVPVFKRGDDLLYLNPETKSISKVNPSAIQGLGMALPIGGDIAGTMAGTTAGTVLGKHPMAAVAGETVGSGVGTAIGEFARLYIGKVIGANDLSFSDIISKSGVEGVKASAATGVVGTLATTAKGINNFVKGGHFTKDEAMKHGMNSKEAEAVLEEVNNLLGKKGAVKGTLGKLTDDVAVKSKEAEVRRLSEHAQKFVDRDIADQEHLLTALDIVTKPSSVKGGASVADVAEKSLSKRIQQGKGILSSNVEALSKKLSQIGGISQDVLGKGVRQVILDKEKAIHSAQKGLWSGLNKKHGYNESSEVFNIKIPVGSNVKNAAAILKRRAEASTTLSGRKSASNVFSSIKGKKPSDLADYNRSISDLRKDIRTAKSSRSVGDAHVRDLINAEKALVADRKVALTSMGKGGLLKDIEDAEEATAKYHDVFNNSVINDYLKKDSKGSFSLKNKEFVSKLLKGDANEADKLLSIVGDKPSAVLSVKKGIGESYKDIAYKNGKFNKKDSDTFLSNNNDVLSRFFNKDEIADFKATGDLAEKVAKQESQMTKILKLADSRYGRGKLASLDPDNIVKFITNNTGSFSTPLGKGKETALSKIRFVKSVTKKHPAAWRAFTEEYSTSLRKSVIDIKTGQVDYSKLNKALDKDKDVIVNVMGDKYYKDLQKINKASGILSGKLIRLAAEESRKGIIQTVRASVAPPLTRRGRAFTAGLAFDERRFHRVIADSLLDPNKVKEIAEFAEHSADSRRAAELAVSLGLLGSEEEK